MELYKIAKTIRSKNAGAFMIAIDVFFEEERTYRNVVNSRVLSAAGIAKLYGLPERDVQMYCCDVAQAIKFSMPRQAAIGDFYQEMDLFGGQYYGPLVNYEIPDDCLTGQGLQLPTEGEVDKR